jgi:enoyl-CoA hydratase
MQPSGENTRDDVQSDSVQLDVAHDGVAVLTVNRPDRLNALDWGAMDAFHTRIWQARDDRRIRALVIIGAGDRAFISGGDLAELQHFPTERDGRRLADKMGDALADLDAMEIPVVAAINGHSRGGGCEIAVACDIRIASENASLGFVHSRQGITTAWGGAQRLKRLVGYGRAMELLLTGRIISPQEALALGMVEQIVPMGEALNAARTLALQIASNPPQAVRALKRLLRLGANEAFAEEREALAKLWATHDHQRCGRSGKRALCSPSPLRDNALPSDHRAGTTAARRGVCFVCLGDDITREAQPAPRWFRKICRIISAGADQGASEAVPGKR